MAEYTLFTHGTSIAIETPANLAGSIKVGWGTQVTFQAPVPQHVGDLPDVFDVVGPGSWLHLPLTSMLTTGFGGRPNVLLERVSIQFSTQHCRIQHVHVYDGAQTVHEFNNINLKSTPLSLRDLDLPKPHRVSSAIGLSLFGCAFFEDFNVNGHVHRPRFDGPFPSADLTITAGGGHFTVQERTLFELTVSSLRAVVKVGP